MTPDVCSRLEGERAGWFSPPVLEMPVYEYKCLHCGKAFEELVGHADEAVNCPACGSQEVRRLLSVPASVRVADARAGGLTCCGRTERCESPPCSDGGGCWRR